ncbi:single-stranded DNA-binding protein [Hippea maritima]|uniref:Single-stranded DNA-binding protein n=1 Tax=Hippea maritima (strain ATCC 700847 / DSM 10411 / MH2) TaxID=760142 RepID=F2LU75_HIPMA|nr:single-stranded DNA-binding protein [Hippea maritima]AEA34538.1 single-strand binding protein [Hippea maritima DSM 10411]
MANLNKVMLIGNLTRDPELRYTPAGLGVASFGIAVNTPVGKDEQGNRKTETLFVDVVAFGRQAETIAEYLKKGSLVYIEGRLRYRSWEDANGNRRSKHEIVLNNFQFLSFKDKTEAAQDVVDVPAEDEDIPF